MFVEEKTLPLRPPTLAGFEDWLAHQPHGQVYDYTDSQDCALAQYYKSIGRMPLRFANELFETYRDQCRYMLALDCVYIGDGREEENALL